MSASFLQDWKQREFLDMTEIIPKMSVDNLQDYMDHLSSRLRTLSFILFSRYSANYEALLLDRLIKGSFIELKNAITTLGLITACGTFIRKPPFLKRCTINRLHLSRTWSPKHEDIPDPVLPSGNFWFFYLNEDRGAPSMKESIKKWTEDRLQIDFSTAIAPESLSIVQIDRLLTIYQGYSDANQKMLDLEIAHRAQLKDQQADVRVTLAEAELEEKAIRYSREQGYDLLFSDSDDSEEDIDVVIKQVSTTALKDTKVMPKDSHDQTIPTLEVEPADVTVDTKSDIRHQQASPDARMKADTTANKQIPLMQVKESPTPKPSGSVLDAAESDNEIIWVDNLGDLTR